MGVQHKGVRHRGVRHRGVWRASIRRARVRCACGKQVSDIQSCGMQTVCGNVCEHVRTCGKRGSTCSMQTSTRCKHAANEGHMHVVAACRRLANVQQATLRQTSVRHARVWHTSMSMQRSHKHAPCHCARRCNYCSCCAACAWRCAIMRT
eukprot:4019645-Pleurochrysis_carterae.AAC.2